MDVGKLLLEVRELLGVSQGGLARKVGIARPTVSAYEAGTMSPTVATLTRILAACDLQLRPVLEPLDGDLDAAVDDMLRGPADLKSEAVSRLGQAFDAAGLRWALDGETALAVHGFSLPHHWPAIAVVDEQALRNWLFRSFAQPLEMPRQGSWFDLSIERLALYGTLLHTSCGTVRLRPVTELPVTLPLALEDLVAAVLPVHAVEAAHPRLATLLARWRARGSPAPGATPG